MITSNFIKKLLKGKQIWLSFTFPSILSSQHKHSGEPRVSQVCRLWASSMQMLKRRWLPLSVAGRKWKALPPTASHRQPPTGSWKAKKWEGRPLPGAARPKVCHHFEFKSRYIIFLLWTSRIPLKSKLKGRDPHVCALKSSDDATPAPPAPPAHHPKVWLWEPPCREVILSCSAGGDWLQWRLSAEHFSSQTDHLRIAWNCQQCCTSAPEGLVQSIWSAARSGAEHPLSEGRFESFVGRYSSTRIAHLNRSQCWRHHFI